MSISRVQVNELRQLDEGAWTAILRQVPALDGATVRDVVVEPLNDHSLARYLLTVDGVSDPVPLVGKRTNRREAGFYRDHAPRLRRLVPRCLLQHISHDWSWVVLQDVPRHRLPVRWSAEDVEKVIAVLASFHGAYWQQEAQLRRTEWLAVEPVDEESGYYVEQVWRVWDRLSGHLSPLSSHAMHSAGRLAPTFIRAAVGLEVMRQLGGWPGIVERRHLDALADLLDDPLPVLHPLRELPATLLHGNPSLDHWHHTLFDDCFLLDWAGVSVGAPILDLVVFLESMERLHTQPRAGLAASAAGAAPIAEETMVDSYLLRLHIGLEEFDARAMRQALPAARCLYVLTHWLPRLGEWFHPFVGSPLTWRHLNELDAAGLRRAGFDQLVGLRSYLADLFVRFWYASKQL
ncbi:MAG: hypothetical protein R3272_00465 [Candidatus Promineifilaceae bacterium]|nr:hypothetical protein [Candidatus Promineifilaceae bacterium]